MIALGTCDECVFWTHKQHGTGECRRYAPRPIGGSIAEKIDGYLYDRSAYWPETGSDEWCGEFTRKEGGNAIVGS